ncbi:MAG TPA: hypothetical protein ENK18_10835 [Deltaproteobacteria bacterium]|nr:hypothetical protein [Deltaproteobacteria bacterium]
MDDDNLEEAATVLMSSPSSDELFRDLRERYERVITDEPEELLEGELVEPGSTEPGGYRLLQDDPSREIPTYRSNFVEALRPPELAEPSLPPPDLHADPYPLNTAHLQFEDTLGSAHEQDMARVREIRRRSRRHRWDAWILATFAVVGIWGLALMKLLF